MVTVASDKGSVGECPERSALVLALLVGQEGWVIDTSIVTFLMKLTDTEGAFLRIKQNFRFEKRFWPTHR